MSTITEHQDDHDGAAGSPSTTRVVTVRAPSVLDAGSTDRLDTSLVTGPPRTPVVIDLTAVAELSLEGAAALVALVRHCRSEGRPLRVVASAPAHRKLALLGLDAVLRLEPPA